MARNFLAAALIFIVFGWFLSDLLRDIETPSRIPFGAPAWLHVLLVLPLPFVVSVFLWRGRKP